MTFKTVITAVAIALSVMGFVTLAGCEPKGSTTTAPAGDNRP